MGGGDSKRHSPEGRFQVDRPIARRKGVEQMPVVQSLARGQVREGITGDEAPVEVHDLDRHHDADRECRDSEPQDPHGR